MQKQIKQNTKSALHLGEAITMPASPPIPASPTSARACLSLPLPLPDYRRMPRWPTRDSRRPELVLYFVDYALPGPVDWD
jgi:hypothetical protein